MIGAKFGETLFPIWGLIEVHIGIIVSEAIVTNSKFFKKRFGKEKTQNKPPCTSYEVFVRGKLLFLLFSIRLFFFKLAFTFCFLYYKTFLKQI